MGKASRTRRSAIATPAGESPRSLSNNGVMTVPPWEFFDRVTGRTILGDERDSGQLRSIAGAYYWRERAPDGARSWLVSAFDLAGETGETISAAIASLRASAEDNVIRWDVDTLAVVAADVT